MQPLDWGPGGETRSVCFLLSAFYVLMSNKKADRENGVKRVLLTLALLCAGCGREADPPSPPNGCTTVSNGTCIGFDAAVDTSNLVPSAYVSLLENAYNYAADCMVQQLGPQYKAEPGPVVKVNPVDKDEHSASTSMINGQVSIAMNTLQFMEHESVHYLLWREGASNVSNENHEPGYIFNICGPLYNGIVF